MRNLLSSLREKKRYLAYKLISENKLDPERIKQAINAGFIELFGQLGLSKINLVHIETEKDKGIIRVNNKYVDYAKASMALIDKINDIKVLIRTVNVSGILKKAKTGG